MEVLIGWLIIWSLLGCLPGAIAQAKGRSFGGFWLYGVLLFPVALIHSLVMAPSVAGLEQQELERGELRTCPHCAELVKREARLCKHCQQALEPLPAASPAPAKPVGLWRDEVGHSPRGDRGRGHGGRRLTSHEPWRRSAPVKGEDDMKRLEFVSGILCGLVVLHLTVTLASALSFHPIDELKLMTEKELIAEAAWACSAKAITDFTIQEKNKIPPSPATRIIVLSSIQQNLEDKVKLNEYLTRIGLVARANNKGVMPRWVEQLQQAQTRDECQQVKQNFSGK